MDRAALTFLILAALAAPAASSLAAEMRAFDVELYGEGVISTTDDELGIAFAPDARTAYFTKRSPTTNTPPRSVICVAHRTGARWNEPEIAPFSGSANDFGIAVSADGRRIVFTSDRAGGIADAQTNFDLWYVERSGAGWTPPRNLGAPINTAANEAYPSIAADGTLYFSATRPGGKGGPDIYRARWLDGNYGEPENLADINTAGYESQPAIAPDQRFLVFTSSDREDTAKGEGAPYSRTDLYISFRDGEHWTQPRHLPSPINTAFNESTPGVSPDGRWLYFASDRGFASVPMTKRLRAHDFEAALHGTLNDWNNIYRVPVSEIEPLRDSPPAQESHSP